MFKFDKKIHTAAFFFDFDKKTSFSLNACVLYQKKWVLKQC